MTTRLPFLAVLLSAAACAAAAQPATAEAAPDTPEGVGIKVSFRPSVAIVVGIFTMIFSLTFLLLMYAKFCHTSPGPAPAAAQADGLPVAVPSTDGVAKPVIESLPFFRFAALRGARQGLECAVCLARFDDADLLRLLPRCRHAFHLDCVDRWLESKASCPLCRARVEPDDAALGLKYAASARFVFGGSERFDEGTASGRDLLDIFVERVPSSRMEAPSPAPALDRHKHRIVVSDVVFKSRWSEINSADLIALDTQLLRSMSSGHFPDDVELYGEAADQDDPAAIKEETERKRLLEVASNRGGVGVGISETAVDAARMISSGVRSMSEMVSQPRLRAPLREPLTEEDRARRRWVPIARRTARWFAGRERRHVKVGEEEEAVDNAPPSHV
ncbi:hypothetical protein ABZP36_013046 [Zizania latifolia]